MTKNHFLPMVIALLIPCINATNEICGWVPETRTLEAVGTVVAYDQLVPLANITWVLQSQVLLIHISKSIKGRAEGPYIKVVYKYAANDSPLPQDIFDGDSEWRFTLKRDSSCDSSLREMKALKPQVTEGQDAVPRLKFKTETEMLGDDVNLPCYVLKPGEYRMEK